MRIALVSSNQGSPEEDITDVMTSEATKALELRGVTVESFHTHGFDSDKAERLAELKELADQAVAWKPDRLYGIHIDSKNDKRRTGILMCVASNRSTWANSIGKAIATATNYPFEGTYATYGGYVIISRPEKKGIPAAIIEVSEYSDNDILELRKRAVEIGTKIGNVLADEIGAPPLEEVMAIDNVDPSSAKVAQDHLKSDGLLKSDHPFDKAVGVGLLWVMLDRERSKRKLLEDRIKALEEKK